MAMRVAWESVEWGLSWGFVWKPCESVGGFNQDDGNSLERKGHFVR